MQDDAQMSGERAGEGGLVQGRDGSRGVLEDWPQLCVAGRRFERRRRGGWEMATWRAALGSTITMSTGLASDV